MRTTQELLEILDKNLCHLESGLCHLAGKLWRWKDISSYEYTNVRGFISENRPSKWSSLSCFLHRNDGFYWKKGDRVPRRKWLEKQIKKLS
jgi:hypothetical protein